MRIWLHIILMLITLQSVAQTASLVSNINKIEIGDQVDLSIRFTLDASINPQEVIYPQLKADQSLNDTIDIISVSDPKVESTTDNQGKPLMIWQQNFVVGIYAGGKIQVGPFIAIHKGDTITTNVTTIQVGVPELEKDKGFVGIKGISKDPYTFWEKVWMWIKEHWMALLIVFLVFIGTIITAVYLTRKPKEKVIKGPVIPLPIQLMTLLEEIEKEQLWQKGKHKEYYVEVTGVIRKFIEYKYEIKALEQTSHEIIDSLRLSSIEPTMMNRIQNLFAISDLIKFAKSLPSPKENEEAMSIAKSILAAEIHEIESKKKKK